MDTFVAFRVVVHVGETNRDALNRTLAVGTPHAVPFPLTLTTLREGPYRWPTPESMPDVNFSRDGYNWFVRFEAAS